MLRGEKEQLEKEQLESSTCSHPPEDYADTFTTQDKQLEEIVRLKSKKPKWMGGKFIIMACLFLLL